MKRNQIWTLLFVLIGMQIGFAQEKEPQFVDKSALGISDAATIDRLLPNLFGPPTTARELLTEQSVKSNMMPPRKIAANGNYYCYTLCSLLEYYINFFSNYKDNLSPDFIALNLSSTFEMKDALFELANTGTVSAAILPYNSSSLTAAVHAAQKFKIKNYLILFRETTPARQKVFEVRKALQRGNPVLVEFPLDENIKTLQSRVWKPELSLETKVKTIPMIAVSYDESLEQFELTAPFGSQWADNGYVKINYDVFGKLVRNGLVILPEEKYLKSSQE